MGSCWGVSITYRREKQKNMKPTIILFSLVLVAFSQVQAAPDKRPGLCETSDCKACLAPCESCEQCHLCALCFGQTIGPCSRCKFCKDGVKGCKRTCKIGKEKQTCIKCIENCS